MSDIEVQLVPDDADAESASEFELTQEELEDVESADPTTELITYTGSDFDVFGLVRRLDGEDIIIPRFGLDDELETAGFQRGFVWNRNQMDRFIESLLLGYPVPGIILVQQTDKRYLVLDGQQRLGTLRDFYRGIHRERQFTLSNVADEFKGLTYDSLPDELRRTLDNTFIPATVVKTDGSARSLEAVYQVFERLNSGGTQLTAHEIRVALYAGELVEFLARLNSLENWRLLYGVRQSPRLRDQELILRVIALYLDSENYRRPLKKFLNDFVSKYRNMENFPTEKIEELFLQSTSLLYNGPGPQSLRGTGKQVNSALAEATLVGLWRRLDSGEAPEPADVAATCTELVQNPELVDAVSKATADEENVRRRLSITTAGFAEN